MDKAAVQAELQKLGQRVALLLQSNFIGLYIMGSFTMGAWNPQSSDIDFLVVLKQPANADEDAALQALHAELAQSEFGKRLEGEYIDLPTLRRKDFDAPIGTVMDGVYFPNYPGRLSADNILCLIQYGQCIAGAPIEQLSLHVTTQELNEAVYEMLKEDSERLAKATDFKTITYLIINSLRCIYALRTGQLPTKQKAIIFNRDILSDDLYTNLISFQERRVPEFAIPLAEVQAILAYGLALQPGSGDL